MDYSYNHDKHNLDLIYGFESYLENPSESSVSSTYLKTTLSLHGLSFNAVEGSEGFVSEVKEVGRKFYEFIKRMIKTVWDFLFGSRGARDDKKVQQAVAAIDVTSRKLPEEIKKATPEVQEAVAIKAEQMVSEISVPFNISRSHDKFFNNKDGIVTDARKAGVGIGVDIPAFEREIARVNELYENLLKNIDNIKVAKNSGGMMGTISTISQAAYLGGLYKGLRDEYKKMLDPMLKLLGKANEYTDRADKHRNENPENDKLYRQGRKVTVFLADYTQSLQRSIDGCTKNVDRIAEKFDSMLIKLNYHSPAQEHLTGIHDAVEGID